MDDIERFLSYVEDYSDINKCWNWRGRTTDWGYGQLWYHYKTWVAHCWIYACLFGPIPAKHIVHHTCHNKRCVNPCHLKCMSRSAHRILHKISNKLAERTHCKYGHEFSEANTSVYTKPNGLMSRECKECKRIYQQKRRSR